MVKFDLNIILASNSQVLEPQKMFVPTILLAIILLFSFAQQIVAVPMNNMQGSDTVAVQSNKAQVVTTTDEDYDAYIRELYGTDKKVTVPDSNVVIVAETDQPRKKRRVGPAPGLFKRSILNGAHLAFNAASPFTVSQSLFSWYSYIDAGITLKTPYELYVESIPIYFLFEISSFNFENSYPEGGSFSGLSYILQASTIGDHSGAVLGFGVWDGKIGTMMEMNYRFRPTKNTFFRLGTRGVLITHVADLGLTWWLELRLSLGLEL